MPSNLVQSEEWPDCRCLGKARAKFSPISDAEKTEATRGIDTTAVLLLSALVGTAPIYFGYFTPFGVWPFVCFAFLAVGPYFLAGASKP
jgi:hypothetical protein